jgi:hypothetical protein
VPAASLSAKKKSFKKTAGMSLINLPRREHLYMQLRLSPQKLANRRQFIKEDLTFQVHYTAVEEYSVLSYFPIRLKRFSFGLLANYQVSGEVV